LFLLVRPKTSLVPWSSTEGLVPFGPQVSSVVRRLAFAIRPLKQALDERDSWNRAAHAHEQSQFSSSSMRRSGSRSVGRARGPTSMNPSSSEDLRIKPPDNRNVPTRVPRLIQSVITWDVVKLTTVITTATGGVTEINFSFSMNSHPQVASWTALFDQWTIPQASISFESQMPPGATIAPCVLYTAIDFDSTNSLGSAGALQDFSSCRAVTMTPQTSFVRSVRPTVKVAVQTAGSIVSASTERTWVDSAQPSTIFLGIRSLASATVGGTYSIDAITTLWFAFRNQI
jgi:hypothetical protein